MRFREIAKRAVALILCMSLTAATVYRPTPAKAVAPLPAVYTAVKFMPYIARGLTMAAEVALGLGATYVTLVTPTKEFWRQFNEINDEDPEDKYAVYAGNLEKPVVNAGVAISGFSTNSLTGNIGYYCGYYAPCSLNNLVNNSGANVSSMMEGLGVNSNVAITGIYQKSPYYLLGFYFDETGRFSFGRFENPSGIYSYKQLGVYSLADLTLIVSDPVGRIYYSKSYAERAVSTGTWYAMNFSIPFVYGRGNNGNVIGIPVFSRNFDQSAYWGSSTFVDMSMTTTNGEVWNYTTYAVSDVIWDNTLRIPVNSETRPQGAIDIISELQSLRDTVTDLSGNPYTDFLLGQVGEGGKITTTHSPAVYDEETLVFTEPVTGAQYQTVGWTYDYNTRCYDLELEPGTFLIGDAAIDQILLTYGDDGLTLDYRASGVSVQQDEFAYVVAEPVAEGSCTHTYTSETLSQSTCTTPGVVRQTCSLCGGIINDTLPLAPHTYRYETITAPTCIQRGERRGSCTVCGNQKTETLDLVPHVYTYTITQQPTCLLPGQRTGVCTTCEGETVEDLPALGHEWRLVQRVPTTYADDGSVLDYTHDLYQCPTCREQYKDYALEGVPETETKPETKPETDTKQWDKLFDILDPEIKVDGAAGDQESWFLGWIDKFAWIRDVYEIYKQLITDVTSDAATAAAIADGELTVDEISSAHATPNTVAYTAPELAISFGASDKYGVDWANIKPIDLSWYAPYKETVDGIMSGILWLGYLFLLIRRVPDIIRGSGMVLEKGYQIEEFTIKKNYYDSIDM